MVIHPNGWAYAIVFYNNIVEFNFSLTKATIPINPVTVNVDIFACINFREIMKMGNFACIKIRVLSITGSLWYYKSNFRGVHNFANI